MTKMNTRDVELISGIILMIIIGFGTIGNALSLAVWTTGKRCKKLPGSIFMTAIAVSDTFVLGFSAIPFAVGFVFGFNLYDASNGVCKVFMSTEHLFKLTSVWFILSLTVTRTIVVCRPLQSLSITTKRTTLRIISGVIIISIVLNTPWTFGSKLITDRNSTPLNEYDMRVQINKANKSQALADSETDNAISRHDGQASCNLDPNSFISIHERVYHNWFIDFVLLFMLPLVVITGSNTAMLITIRRENKALKVEESGRHGCDRQDRSLNNSLTAWVVSISTFHVISEGFWAISSQIPGFVENLYKDEAITCWYIATCCIWYLNHSVNFVLYSVFGTAFRQDFIRLFCEKCRKRGNDINDFCNIQSSREFSSTSALVSQGTEDFPVVSHL